MDFGKLVGIAACAGLVFAAGPAHASCRIIVNGAAGPILNSIIPVPNSGETLAGTYGMSGTAGLCGSGRIIEAPSGTCTVNLDIATSTIDSGDCITLDEGVRLNGNGNEIVCGASSGTCGKGVRVLSSGGSSDKVEVKDLKITGAWTTGVRGESGNNFHVSRVTVDLEGAGVDGITGAVKSVDGSLVTNGTDDCIDIGSGDVSNSQVSFCDDFGINAVEPAKITNSFVHNNGKAFEVNVSLVNDITLVSSVVYDNACNTYFSLYSYCSNSFGQWDVDTTWIDLDYHP